MTHPHLLEGAGPQLPMEFAQPQQEAAQQSNIYRIAWQRKSLLILGLVLGVVIGLLYYSQKDPAYQSKALIHLNRKNPAALHDKDGRVVNSNTDFVADFATLLITPRIIERVAQDPDVRRLATFEGKDPGFIINNILGNMMVNRDTRDANSRTNILQITFKGPVPDDCRHVISAIIKAFQEYLQAANASAGSEDAENIKKMENTYRQEFANLSKQHSKFREENPAIFSNNDKNPMLAKLEMLESVKLELEKNLNDVQSRLDALNKGIAQGMGMGLWYLMPGSTMLRNNQADNPISMVSTNEKLMGLQLQLKQLSAQVGPNHPDYKQTQAAIDALQGLLTQQTKALSDKNEPNQVSENPIKTMMNAFQLEAERTKALIKTYENLISRDKEQIKQMGQLYLTDMEFVSRKEMTQKTLIALADKINANKALKDQPIYVAEIWQPPTAAMKVEPRFFVIMTLSTIIGLLGGFGLAYLADMTDKSFRSPEEIRRRLNIPVVGHVPMLISEEEAAKLEGAINGPDPTLVTYYRPKSRKAEVFRGIRTALYFSTRGEGHKVIQITSPNMGDGKTTLSSNLAVSIAQSGKQTILIDGDFRRPRLHKIFAVPSEKGFASVIMGQCDLREAVQPTVVPGLSVMPCGPIPPNPAELLTSPRFKELMDELRELYDYVIIDTPPLLVVTDPCVVAPRVDGVLLTMRVVKNGRPIAERARDILVSLGAKPLGVVVNGVSMAGPSGYGYGYGYGFGYGYGQYDYSQAYQYKYDYSDRYYAGYGDEGYYQDRDATELTPPIPRDANPVNRLPAEPTEPAAK